MTSASIHDAPVFDVLLEGTPSCDLTFLFNHRDNLPLLGQEIFADRFAANPGASFNIAAALTRLSLRVGLMAVLGDDMFSHFIAERMRSTGISLELTTWVDYPVPVISAGISFPHDRLFVSYEPPAPGDPGRHITVADLDRYRPRAILTYGELAPEVFREARARGIVLYADTYWDPEHLHDPALRDLAESVDIFSPNLTEALEMTGAGNGEEALEVLSAWGQCIVIKCGAMGCIAARDGERFAVAAPTITAVDTTGAGDNFNAGLIYGLLQGYPFRRSLECAVITGALSTLTLGGSGGTMTADDLEQWLTRTSTHNASGVHS